jgi:hypothetical protein
MLCSNGSVKRGSSMLLKILNKKMIIAINSMMFFLLIMNIEEMKRKQAITPIYGTAN